MQFSGIGVALVTPFKSDKSIDYDALASLIDKVITGGVTYLVALGTTAETPTLTPEEKKNILAFIIEKNNGRVPVVCGIGGNNTREIIETIEAYQTYKIDGILSVAPYYNKPSQEGIYQHFKAIAASTQLPIILYNVPGRTVSNIQPETVARLAKECANIVAIKEASGNLVQCMQVVQSVPDSFTVLSGDDNLILAQAAIGMKGVISVAANCYPHDFCAMVQAALDGDFAAAREKHYGLLEDIDLLFAEGNPTGVKYVLHRQELISNELRLPLVPASESLASRIDSRKMHQ